MKIIPEKNQEKGPLNNQNKKSHRKQPRKFLTPFSNIFFWPFENWLERKNFKKNKYQKISQKNPNCPPQQKNREKNEFYQKIQGNLGLVFWKIFLKNSLDFLVFCGGVKISPLTKAFWRGKKFPFKVLEKRSKKWGGPPRAGPALKKKKKKARF